MNEKDFLHGCRSGIQKAARRGNMDLARTCFDALWPLREHRHWLLWRLPILVFEEAVYLTGELKELLDQKSRDERDWRRFYYRMVLSDKARDAVGLRIIYTEEGIPDSAHPELETFRGYDLSDPGSAARNLLEYLVDEYRVNKYTAGAMELLAERAYWGGRLADRQTMLAAMVLLAHRGLEKEQVLEVSDACVRRFLSASNGKPKTVSLPWYVFDTDTRIGMAALKAFLKKHKGVDKDRLRNLWFYMESAFTPKGRSNTCAVLKDEPKAWESMWWPMAVRINLTFKGREPKDNARLWVNQVRPEMRQIVEWVLEVKTDR